MTKSFCDACRKERKPLFQCGIRDEFYTMKWHVELCTECVSGFRKAVETFIRAKYDEAGEN